MNFRSTQGVLWKYSPPTGPDHGSIWENGVKASKLHLRRIVGESKLTFEEIATVLWLGSTPDLSPQHLTQMMMMELLHSPLVTL